MKIQCDPVIGIAREVAFQNSLEIQIANVRFPFTNPRERECDVRGAKARGVDLEIKGLQFGVFSSTSSFF